MEENNENPSHVNRLHVDGVDKTDIVELNKKRKSQSDQLDLLRPKHKCWVGTFPSENDLMFDGNPVLESMHIHMVKGRTDATFLDDSSEPESAKDSNSFTEDSNTSMTVNEEAKLEADSAKTSLYWDDYNIKDSHCSLDASTVEKVSSGEEDRFVDNKYNLSYHDTDLHDLKILEEHFLELGSHLDHMYSEYAKDSNEQSGDKEFEDTLYSNGMNANMYVLSSGRWNVNQEAQSSTMPPTIDQEFEQYFSTLML